MLKIHSGSAAFCAAEISWLVSGSWCKCSCRSYFFRSDVMTLNMPLTRHVSTVTTVSFKFLRTKCRRPSRPGITFTKMSLNFPRYGFMISGSDSKYESRSGSNPMDVGSM